MIKLAALKIAYDKVTNQYLYLKERKDRYIRENENKKTAFYWDNVAHWISAMKTCSNHCKELDGQIGKEIKRLELFKTNNKKPKHNGKQVNH